MVTKEILNSHPVSVLKKEISKTNIKGYSKMKKAEVVELMAKNKSKFGHIKMATKSVKSAPKKKIIKKTPKKPSPSPKKKSPSPKKPSPKKTKKKLLSKKDFIEDLEVGNDDFGLKGTYADTYTAYINDYPEIANTERQMDKLGEYAARQVNKQLYSHYKKEGNLKNFVLELVYGKAF